MYRLLSSLLLLFALQVAVATESDVPAGSFVAEPLSDAVFLRMQGKSFKPNPHIARSDLRYLRVLHYDADGQVRQGELVCNKAIADDLLDIFRELYRQHYPIGRMQLIDDFDADDERSMRANNTTCFCYRAIAGSAKLSKHAQGLAIDINPLYNPCVRTGSNGKRLVQPSCATRYVDRSATFPYKIVRGDLLHRLFLAHGFRWGGAWKSLKDYQHFEK